MVAPDVDIQVENGFAPFFKNLPKDDKLVRFFERKEDFFTVHGRDAEFVAENVYQTTTVLKYYGSLASCSLSRLGAQQFIKDLLLSQGFKIEIWIQEGKSWAVEKKASPGNLKQVEDFLFSNSDLRSSPVVASVWVDPNCTAKQSVKECVLQKDTGTNYDLKIIAGVLERCEIVCTYVKSAYFNSDNVAQDLKRLTKVEIGLMEVEYNCAMKCVACLINYLDLLSDDSNLGAYRVDKFNLNSYMKLDASAVKALNLIPGPKDGKKNNNLFGLLNRCKTAQGSRLLAQWIKQPLMNLALIKERQDLVQVFFNDSLLRQNIQEVSLKAFPDLHRLAKKFQRGKAGLQDVVRIYQVVKNLPGLISNLQEYKEEHMELITAKFVSNLERIAQALVKLEELVETTIDLEASDNHEFIIKPDYDPSLQEVRGQMEAVFSQLKPEARRVAEDIGVEFEKKLKFENNPQFGYHMRLSRNDASKIRGNNAYIELRTLKAGVMFTTPALRRLSTEYFDLGKEYSKLQTKIAKEVVSITATYFPILEEANEVAAEIDVILSLAEAAFQAPTQYVRPVVTQDGSLSLNAGRHPCVEVQDDVSFIENDTLLERDSLFSIITGPNMGGKSTYIRQIGVICLMAQMGSFVPCQEATIPISDAILARVGAGDTQLKGISTFMAEMLETAAILRVATKRSLIIIDELGRGTSTKDGFGLAWAIAEYIVKNVSCFTLFATHFHEITSMEQKYSTVRNYHVQAQISDSETAKSLTLLYKVLKGACDQSFGIHVAKLCQFPDSVIQMAKRKSAELEGFKDDSAKRWKSSPEEIRRGEEKINAFMEKFRQLDGLNGLEELRSEVRKEMETEPFIYEVVNEF